MTRFGASPALGLSHPVGPDTAAQVDSGRNHVCKVTDGGHALCWGDNDKGQIGQGPIGGQFNKPEEVVAGAGLTPGTVAQISAGGQHTCAVTTGGDAYCWGDNGGGRLGDGTSGSGTGQNTPVQVVGLGQGTAAGPVAQISAGAAHTCAVTDDGDAYCWGSNGSGRLGDGTTGSSTTPVQVVAGQGLTPGTVAQISSGNSATCAVDSDGDAYCWGRQSQGQLGNGTSGFGYQPVPARVSDLGSGTDAGAVAHIDAAEYNGCATTVDGEAYCWGWNGHGQIGDGTMGVGTDRDTPEWVIGSGVVGSGVVADFVHVGGGRGHTCGVDADGIVYCWGWNRHGQLGDGTSGINPDGRPLLGPTL